MAKSSTPQIAKPQNNPAPKNIEQTSHIFKENQIIAIGSSTGGTEAIKQILPQLPSNFPPIVITQHMPKDFTALFAKRMNALSRIHIQEASDGQLLKTGNAYIAPGGKQMSISRRNGAPTISICDSEPVNGHKPSVEFLFDSLKNFSFQSVTSVLLTGMGKDGAVALNRLRKSGAFTIAQDKESSVVFGMPGEAIRLGAATEILPLSSIAKKLIEQTKE